MSINHITTQDGDVRLANRSNSTTTNKDENRSTNSCDESTPPVSVKTNTSTSDASLTPIEQIKKSEYQNTESLGKESAKAAVTEDCGGKPPPTSVASHFAQPLALSTLIASSQSQFSSLLLQQKQQPQQHYQIQQQPQQLHQLQLERRSSQLAHIYTPIQLNDQCRPQMLDSPETEAQHQTKLQHSLVPDTSLIKTIESNTKSQLDNDKLVFASRCDNIPSKLQLANRIVDEHLDHLHDNQQDQLCESPTIFQLRALSDKPVTFASATKQHRRRQENKVLEQLRKETSIKQDKQQSDKRHLPYPTESDQLDNTNDLLILDNSTEEEEEEEVDTNNIKKEFLGLDVHTRDLISKLESNPWIQTPALPPNLHITNLSHEVISETLNYFVICGERLTLMTKTYDDIDAVVKLLQEKEVDLELAARIGQDLLEQNKQLKSSIHELEVELVKRKEDVQQLKHELASKTSLLQTFIEEEDDDGDDDEHYPSYQSEARESIEQRNHTYLETSNHHSLSFVVANDSQDITSKRHLINNDIVFDSDSDSNEDQRAGLNHEKNHQSKLFCQNESMIASSPQHREKSWQFNRLVVDHQDELATSITSPQPHHYYPDQHQSLKNCIVTGNNADTKLSEKLGKENEILERTDAILNTVRSTEKDNEEQRLLVQNVTLQLVESNKRLCELQEELAIKSEQNQQQQERIQSLLTQLRESDRRVNEIGRDNDSLQNSIKASLECQKELSDELKDCKRNLSELLSVFVELQQESRRYRLANNKSNKTPKGFYDLAKSITTSINNDAERDHANDDDDNADDDVCDDDDVNITNHPFNDKLLSTNDVRSYWQSPFELLAAGKHEAIDEGVSNNSLLLSKVTKSDNTTDKQTLRNILSKEYDYLSTADYLNAINICDRSTANSEHDEAATNTDVNGDIETLVGHLSFAHHSSNKVNDKTCEQETSKYKVTSEGTSSQLLVRTRNGNDCSPAESLAAEIASTLVHTTHLNNRKKQPSPNEHSNYNNYHQQQQQHLQLLNHHSVLNTDSEDASLGYESENSTTTSTTASTNNQNQLGYLNNGRRRSRRYQQHRQQHQPLHRSVQNNICCSVSPINANAHSSNSIISGPSNVNCYHHHHCNYLFNGESRTASNSSQPTSCQSVPCDACMHRFVQPIPICLHGGVACSGQSHHHQQCKQQSTGATDIHSSHDHQEVAKQHQQNENTLTPGSVSDHFGGSGRISEVYANENVCGKQINQQLSYTSENLTSIAASNATTPVIADGAKATTPTAGELASSTTKRSLPNSSLLSNKLRLIKMMEGSKYLKQWERLASLDLGSILQNEICNNDDETSQSIDLNSISSSTTNHMMSNQEDSYEKRRQNAAATMATLSGLRSQLLSQISLSSSTDANSICKPGEMIDDPNHHQSLSTTAASTPSMASSSLVTSLASTSASTDGSHIDIMMDEGKNNNCGGASSHNMNKNRPSVALSGTLNNGFNSGFNLLLSKGAPTNDNINPTTSSSFNGSQGRLTALLGKSSGSSSSSARANNRLTSIIQQTQQQNSDNVSNALKLKRNNNDNIYDGIIASTLSLRAQGGPPLTMDEIRRKLRLTDSSGSDSDSDSDEQQSPSSNSRSTAMSLDNKENHQVEDRKGSSDTNGHIIDIITILTAVIIGINENFGDPMLH